MKALAIVLFMQANSPPAAKLALVGTEARPPEVPASNMLEMSPTSVRRPSDTQAFQLHVPTMLGNAGASAGFGLSSYPYRTYLYERAWNAPLGAFEGILSGFNLSLAMANVPKSFYQPDNDGQRFMVAATAGLQLYNERDPLRNRVLANCLDGKADMMSHEYRRAPDRREWGPVSRERIDKCLKGPTQSFGLGSAATDYFGSVWGNYEISFGKHAITGQVEKRFAHHYGLNSMDLGLRYTHEWAFVSWSKDFLMEVLPADYGRRTTTTRFSSGAALTLGLPSGLTLTIGMRALTAAPEFSAKEPDYRGYLGVGWGGYDVQRDYFARGLVRPAVKTLISSPPLSGGFFLTKSLKIAKRAAVPFQ